jgi:hypothetical protein
MTTVASSREMIRSCERVTVTRVVVKEGDGNDMSSPVREVVYFYDDEGRLIARRDGWEEAAAHD